MSTTITYDDFSFTGSEGFPTPYVSRSQNMLEYGNRWGQGTSYTLNGQITGNNFDDLINKQNILLSGFSRDFKSLDITEDGESIAGFPTKECKINSINFDGNKYASILDYSISIDAYDESLFSGTHGVIDPSNEISISENTNGEINIGHNISAVGIRANNKSAIENAKDFVHLHSGWKKSITPQFIKYQESAARYNSNDPSQSPFDNWGPNDGSIAIGTVAGKTDCLKYTLNSNNNDDHYAYINNVFTIGKKYKIYGQVYLNDVAYADIYSIGIFTDSDVNSSTEIIRAGQQGVWKSFETEEFIAETSNLYVFAHDGGDYITHGDSYNRDWFVIRDIRIEESLDFDPLLLTQNESINRMNGSYSMTEQYILSKTGENSLFSGHSVSISSGANDPFVQVNLSTNFKGHYKEDISEVRNKIPSLNSVGFYQIAKDTSQISDLNSGALNFNVSEDSGNSQISINCSFNNNKLFTGSNAYFDYRVSFDTNEMTSNTTVQLEGQIRVIGNNKDKLRVAEDFLENTINSTVSGGCNHEAKYACYLYSLANEEYNKLSIPYSLRPYPVNCTIDKNESKGTISLNASFDNTYQYSNDVKTSRWNIQVAPPLRKYLPTSDVLTFPKNIFWNTDVVTRSNIQVNASASSYDSINKSFGLTTVDNFITNVYNTYVVPNSDIIETSNTLNFSERNLLYNRNKSWGFHNNTEWITLPAPPKP